MALSSLGEDDELVRGHAVEPQLQGLQVSILCFTRRNTVARCAGQRCAGDAPRLHSQSMNYIFQALWLGVSKEIM